MIETQRQNIGARHTLELVQSFVPVGRCVLDAGCGNGVLARQLIDAGYIVTAIDKKAEAIAECRELEVQAIERDFLEYENQDGFDVVLLSRALHHMDPLETTLERAQTLLRKDGLLIVEDFGAELIDANSAAWFYGLKAVIAAGGVPTKSRGPSLEDGNIPQNPMQSWNDHHFAKHGVTTSEAMTAGLRERFHILAEHRIPYLYRYFLDDVSEQEARQIFQWERFLCDRRMIVPIGVRIVGKKRS